MSKFKLQSSSRMTEGNPYKLIFSFSVPIMLGNIFQQFYNLVDLTIVSGKLGTGAMASVGATYVITGFLYSFINGLTNGFSIITAQYYGAGNAKEMRRSVAATISFSLLLTLLFTAVALLLVNPLLRTLHTPDTLMADAYNYVSVLLWGLIFTMLYNMFANILKAIGNSVVPLIFLVISAAINIGLDILFVNVFELGIRGASLATVISQAISASLCLIYIITKCPEVHIHAKDFHFDSRLIGKMLTTGFSMSMMLSVINVGSIILQSGINTLGETTLVAHTAARKIMEFTMMPVAVLAASCATFTSQNYGGGKMDRIWKGTKAALIMGFAWSAFACAFTIPLSPYLVAMIANDHSPEILQLGNLYLRIGIPLFFPLTVFVVLRNALQGIDQRFVPIFCSVLELVGKIIAINLLVPSLGYLGVCLTEPIIWLGCGIVILIYYLVIKSKMINTTSIEK